MTQFWTQLSRHFDGNIQILAFHFTLSMDFFRSLFALDSPIRVFYHHLRGIIAFHIYGNPARDMVVIGITGSK
jgi:hypothetical protein